MKLHHAFIHVLECDPVTLLESKSCLASFVSFDVELDPEAEVEHFPALSRL